MGMNCQTGPASIPIFVNEDRAYIWRGCWGAAGLRQGSSVEPALPLKPNASYMVQFGNTKLAKLINRR
jgi:hypothetical protein